MSAHQPVVRHATLKTTFTGIQHSVSTPDAPVHQYRGIKYAAIPARLRQSTLFTTYHSRTDSTRFGPVCPQPRGKTIEEELFGFSEDEFPVQNLKQIESECLNLNISCPAGLSRESRLPVMVWIHGGGNRGSGNHWLFDGGALVQNSIRLGKPIILVTFNYRLGILGFAASPQLREDNEAAGGEGVGNYGLRDQRRAFEWVYHFISEFGGDPGNVTVLGESTGATDLLCHLSSKDNAARPLFHRAIVQSAIFEGNVPNQSLAGSQLSRAMSALGVSSIDELRKVDVDKLVMHGASMRAVDDGVFFKEGWREFLGLEDRHHHHPHIHETTYTLTAHSVIEQHLAHHHGSLTPPSKVLQVQVSHAHTHPHPHPHSHPHPSPPRSHSVAPPQPLMIGDCGFESFLYTVPASLWTPAGVVRRIKAVCQNLHKAASLFRAYDISSHTPEDELAEHILDLINDARFAWPTHRVADAFRRHPKGTPVNGGGGVWRYVFDQEAPKRGIPHHAVDLLYLFDTAPPAPSASDMDNPSESFPESFSDDEDEDAFDNSAFDSSFSNGVDDDSWTVPTVDAWTYTRVRDAVQGRWFAFAYGNAPWAEDKVYVFGPEGECGERGTAIFEGRRRVAVWKDVLEPLGRELVQKVGVELSNGPAGWKA
ncbi:alpha/beta-hydrolase [Amylostereum chailletii]|nr:alpha/beta-hydrolase [Amylostereum chailletii]